MTGQAGVAPASPDPAPSIPGRRTGLFRLTLGLTAGWPIAFALGRSHDHLGLWLGAYAAAAAALLLGWHRRGLARALQLRLPPLGVGLLGGALLTAATYLVYPWLRAWIPSLGPEVVALYEDVQVAPPYVPLLLAVVLVEELLWRGSMVDALEDRLPPRWALGVATMAYALAQLGSGTWVVPALALSLGALWAGLRLVTGSLWAPLLCHLLWTGSILLVWPLE